MQKRSQRQQDGIIDLFWQLVYYSCNNGEFEGMSHYLSVLLVLIADW